jgi:hypothetical protein
MEYHGDQNTWNTIPVSEQNNTLNNRTKALNGTNEDRTNKSRTMKLAINNTGTEWLSVFSKRLNHDLPILARVKYLCDYGIDNCNDVLLVC